MHCAGHVGELGVENVATAIAQRALVRDLPSALRDRIFTMVIPMKDIPLDEQAGRLLEGISALANPARLQILEVLAEEPESIVADIVRRLPLAQATVSQHLRVLQDAGLIHDEKAGAGRCCRIDFPHLFALGESLTEWSHRLASASLSTGREEGETCRR